MALSGIERSEIMNRTKAMRDEELHYMLKFVPTPELLKEIARREGLIIDKLHLVCQVWDESIDKPIDQMDIMEKEDLIRSMRRVLNGYE